MSLAYIREYYLVPAYRGHLVEVDSRGGERIVGRITSGTHYLYVRFPGKRRSLPHHPLWKVKYLGKPKVQEEAKA